VNLPGVGLDRYANWSRRIRKPLEDLPSDPVVQQALGALGSDRRRGGVTSS
jgi:4-alpha-glucanotransferase